MPHMSILACTNQPTTTRAMFIVPRTDAVYSKATVHFVLGFLQPFTASAYSATVAPGSPSALVAVHLHTPAWLSPDNITWADPANWSFVQEIGVPDGTKHIAFECQVDPEASPMDVEFTTDVGVSCCAGVWT